MLLLLPGTFFSLSVQQDCTTHSSEFNPLITSSGSPPTVGTHNGVFFFFEAHMNTELSIYVITCGHLTPPGLSAT